MSRLTVHSILLETEIILPRYVPLQSSFARSPCRSPFGARPICPWVSFPLRDITKEQLRFFARPPVPRFGPPAGFLNLSTASSALQLAGLFHPAATSRILCRSGASLPSQRSFLIGRRLPPCRCCIAARRLAPIFTGSSCAHVRCLSTSRPFSAPGSVLQVWLFTAPKVAPLIEFLTPPGLSLSRR